MDQRRNIFETRLVTVRKRVEGKKIHFSFSPTFIFLASHEYTFPPSKSRKGEWERQRKREWERQRKREWERKESYKKRWNDSWSRTWWLSLSFSIFFHSSLIQVSLFRDTIFYSLTKEWGKKEREEKNIDSECVSLPPRESERDRKVERKKCQSQEICNCNDNEWCLFN